MYAHFPKIETRKAKFVTIFDFRASGSRDLLRSLVKGQGNNLGACPLATNIDFNLPPHLSQVRREVGHADIFPQKGRVRTAGHIAGGFAFDVNWMTVARDSPVRHFKTHQLLARALGSLLQQDITADELAFFKLRDPTQVRFQQGSFSIELVAVKRVA